MESLKDIRKILIISKYHNIHLQETERWYRNHDANDLPVPDWLLRNPAEDSPLVDPDTGDDALTNVAVTAFLAGHAIRDSKVDCYHRTLVTTANYVAVKAALLNAGLDNLHRVLFAVDESQEPPFIRLSGGESSLVAPIKEWASFMNDPWDGTWTFAADSDFF